MVKPICTRRLLPSKLINEKWSLQSKPMSKRSPIAGIFNLFMTILYKRKLTTYYQTICLFSFSNWKTYIKENLQLDIDQFDFSTYAIGTLVQSRFQNSLWNNFAFPLPLFKNFASHQKVNWLLLIWRLIFLFYFIPYISWKSEKQDKLM